MTDKQIIEEDIVNAKDFCPYYSCEVDCYEATMCPWFVDTLRQLKRKEQLFDEIKEYFKSKDKRKTSLFNIFVIEQEILGIINKG